MNLNDVTTGNDQPHESEMPALMAARQTKGIALRATGIDPYPYAFEKTHMVGELNPTRFAQMENEGIVVAVPGRVTAVRSHGNLIFFDLGEIREGSKIQVAAVLKDLDAESRAVLDGIDIGDWIGVTGHLMYTRTRQETIRASQLVMLSKATRPLPNFKGSGIADPELLAQMPELAMIFGDKRRILRQRSVILRTLRGVLTDMGLTEIETPYLNPHFGGAEARPFTTHVNALSTDVFLAVSPEIELKRLIVGGLVEGVFAIARNFRNEGIDQSHNPEFTSMETYIPFVDYEAMMDLTEDIFSSCCIAIHGVPYCEYRDVVLDFTPPWARISMVRAVEDVTGIEVSNIDAVILRATCHERVLDEGCNPADMASADLVRKLSDAGISCPIQRGVDDVSGDILRGLIIAHRLHVPMNLDQEWDFLVLDMFERFIEPTLIQPCHVTLHPARSTVLCKKYRGGPLPNGHELLERFESYVAGMEVSNAYSELNDPEIQRRLVEEQAAARVAGNEEAMPHNELFLRSIEYGMPPCGGLGIGVDRMVMLLTGATSIKEVIAFPLVKS